MTKISFYFLLGAMVFVGSLFSFFGNIAAKSVITFAGELNIIYLGIIVECSRLIIYAFVKYG